MLLRQILDALESGRDMQLHTIFQTTPRQELVDTINHSVLMTAISCPAGKRIRYQSDCEISQRYSRSNVNPATSSRELNIANLRNLLSLRPDLAANPQIVIAIAEDLSIDTETFENVLALPQVHTNSALLFSIQYLGRGDKAHRCLDFADAFGTHEMRYGVTLDGISKAIYRFFKKMKRHQGNYVQLEQNDILMSYYILRTMVRHYGSPFLSYTVKNLEAKKDLHTQPILRRLQVLLAIRRRINDPTYMTETFYLKKMQFLLGIPAVSKIAASHDNELLRLALALHESDRYRLVNQQVSLEFNGIFCDKARVISRLRQVPEIAAYELEHTITDISIADLQIFDPIKSYEIENPQIKSEIDATSHDPYRYVPWRNRTI